MPNGIQVWAVVDLICKQSQIATDCWQVHAISGLKLHHASYYCLLHTQIITPRKSFWVQAAVQAQSWFKCKKTEVAWYGLGTAAITMST
jgi:hypothetical protein